MADGDAGESGSSAPKANPAKLSPGCTTAVVIGLLVVAGLWIMGTVQQNNDEANGTEEGAFSVCQQFVEERLNFPESAEYPNQFEDDGEVLITGSGGRFTVESHVTAQNAFGVPIRSDFTCVVEHDEGDRYELVRLNML